MRFLSTCARTLAVALHLLTSLHGPSRQIVRCVPELGAMRTLRGLSKCAAATSSRLADRRRPAQQLRQLRDVGRDPPRLIVREQTGGRPSARLVLIVQVCKRLLVSVSNDETRVVLVLDGPRRREVAALGHHVLAINRSAASKISKAPGTTRSNTNSKNGEKVVIFRRPESAPRSAATRR